MLLSCCQGKQFTEFKTDHSKVFRWSFIQHGQTIYCKISCFFLIQIQGETQIRLVWYSGNQYLTTKERTCNERPSSAAAFSSISKYISQGYICQTHVDTYEFFSTSFCRKNTLHEQILYNQTENSSIYRTLTVHIAPM